MKLEVHDLTVRYGRSTAVDAVTFAVEPGTVYALLGRNGAGKSTLLRTLLGQRRPDGGTIRIGGLDPWSRRARLMARIGATPESPDAPPRSTAAELAALGAGLYRRWDGDAFADRIERFGIDPGKRFGELSRGQRSLLQLAFALAPEPELLVLDDPTLGLDAVARRYFFKELVGELADRGTTTLLATHDLAGAERVATHVGMLVEGRLLLSTDIESLRAGHEGSEAEGASLEAIFVSRTSKGAVR